MFLRLKGIGKVKRAGAGYLIGNFVLRGVSFLTIPIFSKLMSPAEYGIYSVYMSYEAFAAVIITLGVAGTLRNAKVDYAERTDDYFVNMLTMLSIMGAAVFAILEAGLLVNINIVKMNALMTGILVIHAYSDGVFTVYLTKLSTSYSYRKYIVLSFFNTVFSIGLSLFLMVYVLPKETYYGRILGTTLPLLLLSVYIIISALQKSHSFCDFSKWKYAVNISLPLMVHSISLTVLSIFDRIMISNMIGDGEAGIYSLMGSFGNLLSLIWNSLNTAWNQWVFDKIENSEYNQIRQASRVYVACAVAVFCATTMTMPEIICFMTDERYHSGISMIPALCAGAYFSMPYSLYVLIENYFKKNKYVAIGTIFAGSVNILLNYIFIGKYGYEAAAYTTMASYFLLYLFHLASVRKSIRKKVYDDRFVFLLSVCCIPISLFAKVLIPYVLLRWLIAVIIGFILIIMVVKRGRKGKNEYN